MTVAIHEDCPSGWRLREIRDFISHYLGGASLTPSDFVEVGFPVIPKKGVQEGGWLKIDNPTFCSENFAKNNYRSVVDSDYVVTTLRDLVPSGPSIGLIVKVGSGRKYLLSQGTYGLYLSKELDPTYLCLLSNSHPYRKAMQRVLVGSTQVHVRTGEFLGLEFAAPPIEEQKKIAKILSTWDEAIATTKQLMANSKRQKKALMQQLLTGKKRLPGFEGDWFQCRISDVSKVIVSPVDKKTKKGEKPVRLCNYTDVYYNTWIVDNMPFMSATAKDSEITKYTLKKHDVVITKDSETPGDIAVPSLVSEELTGVVCGYHLAILRPNRGKLYGPYLSYLLSMPRCRYYFFTLANGATRFGLSVGAIHDAEITLPPLVEQKAIARAVALCDEEQVAMEKSLSFYKAEKRALMQQLLTGRRRVTVDEADRATAGDKP